MGRTAPLAAERGCTLETPQKPLPPSPILGDADRLLQVLLILLDNATRHSPVGAAVTVEVGRREGLAWVSVADRGPGVPVSDRERIFEPFARAIGARGHRGEGGTGLGLAVARTLVERHHGSIAVDDRTGGGGARFTVSLPLRWP